MDSLTGRTSETFKNVQGVGICANGSMAQSSTVNRIGQLWANAQSLIGHYDKNFGYYFDLSLFGTGEKPDKYVYNKTIFSEKIFNEEYHEILLELAGLADFPEVKEWLLVGNGDLRPLDSEDVGIVYGKFAKIENLYAKATRWSVKQCNLQTLAQNKKYDVLRFFNTSISPATDDEVSEDSLSRIDLLKNILPASIYAYFFDLHRSKQSFSCKKGKLTVKFVNSGDKVLQQAVIRAINLYWNIKSKFKLQPVFVDRPSVGAIILERGDKKISSFQRISNGQAVLMVDNGHLQDDYLSGKIIAHELGHVLGFNDCYVEYYDKTSKEIVYYELDYDNLMCATGGLIPERYVKKVMDGYCKQ